MSETTDYELREDDDRLRVTLMYPRAEGKKVKRVEVDMCCVRSTDSVIVSFCHDRNAWVISRDVVLGYRQDGTEETEEVELALIPAWTNDTKAAENRVVSDAEVVDRFAEMCGLTAAAEMGQVTIDAKALELLEKQNVQLLELLQKEKKK